MTYQETIDFLYTKLPMFERQGPAGYKKDLTNTLALCTYLGDPHLKFKSIHIAGTNGKGSVSHMLSSILQEAGYKTGLYISPHYKEFGERIRVNKNYISKKYVIDFVEKIQPAIESIRPSFFEITVVMAFSYFAAKKVDIAVIETGLGGRLDSTNVITPLLSIITNIGWDHQNILGDSLLSIASEKAGIIKKNIPVLIGEYQPSIIHVFKAKAFESVSKIKIASRMGKVMTQSTKERYVYRSSEGKYIKLDMPYHGPYQEKNINTVFQAIQWLNDLNALAVSNQSILHGLKHIDINAPLIGRFQILNHLPLTIADGAHNVNGLKLVFKKINQIAKTGTVHCVIGTVKDKDYNAVLKLLPKSYTYYFVQANLPRALDSKLLLDMASKYKLNGVACGSVKNGMAMARKQSKNKDTILVTGSIFVVGEVI